EHPGPRNNRTLCRTISLSPPIPFDRRVTLLRRFAPLCCAVAITGACADSTAPAATVAVEITPQAVSLFRAEPRTFFALVTGSENTGITWSSTCGSLQPTGPVAEFTPPAVPTECFVIASSVADPDVSDTALVTVLA